MTIPDLLIYWAGAPRGRSLSSDGLIARALIAWACNPLLPLLLLLLLSSKTSTSSPRPSPPGLPHPLLFLFLFSCSSSSSQRPPPLLLFLRTSPGGFDDHYLKSLANDSISSDFYFNNYFLLSSNQTEIRFLTVEVGHGKHSKDHMTQQHLLTHSSHSVPLGPVASPQDPQR